jgi:hypothetical protein
MTLDYNSYNSFFNLITTFYAEFIKVFPEYEDNINIGVDKIFMNYGTLLNVDNLNEETQQSYCEKLTTDSDILSVVTHIKDRIYKFTSYIYNDDTSIFSQEQNEDSIDTELLPGIDWRTLWNTEDISETTQQSLWNYVKLFYWSLIMTYTNEELEQFHITNMNNESNGDGNREEQEAQQFQLMFEKIMNDMKNMVHVQEATNGDGSTETQSEQNEQTDNMFDMSNINIGDMPNPEDIKERLDGILGGRIGKLAQEIAAETAEELDINPENVTNPQDLFGKLFSNPGKMMKMVKNIEGKLTSKMEKENISEDELMKEAMEMMTNMGSMPGMPNVMEMMKGMMGGGGMPNMPGMPDLSKMMSNPAVMGMAQNKMHQAQETDKIKQRLRQRLERNKELQANMVAEGFEPAQKSTKADREKYIEAQKKSASGNKKKGKKGKKGKKSRK